MNQTRDLHGTEISERAALAICLMSPISIDQMSAIISGDDFFDSQFGELFGLMVNRRSLELPTEPVALLPDAKHIFGPEVARGVIGDLIGNVPGIHHAKYYADQVKKYSKLRELELIASEIKQACSSGETPESIAASVEHRISQIGTAKASYESTAYEAGMELIESLEDSKSGRPVMVGIDLVDRTVGGFMPGELVILAARPGCGKTSLAMQVVENLTNQNRPALFVSLEMRRTELIARVLCGMTDVDSRQVRSGNLELEDIGKLADATKTLDGQPLTIFDPPTSTLPQIKAMAKMIKGISGLEMLCVDYIGLVKPRDARSQRSEQVSEIVGGLKRMAKELEVPVLALSQLNRMADGSEPRLSHLSLSGSVEQDADIVMLLHRESENSHDFKLIIGKHRHGETGSMAIQFDPSTTSFGVNNQWQP